VRSHLKNAKLPDLAASCCSAESSFQQNSLDEFPTGGREFITALRRPLRGVGPSLRPGSGAGGLISNYFSIFEMASNKKKDITKAGNK